MTQQDILWRRLKHNGPYPIPLELRFWEKVNIVEDAFCWEWLAAKDKDGYGLVGGYDLKGSYGNIRAHRFSLELHLGRKIKIGMEACHTCDNVSCVNPYHLFEGTRLDNIRDSIVKGRRADTRGENNGHSGLTKADVLYIRSCGLNRRFLANKFKVTKTTICNIVNKKIWGWL